MSLKSLLGYVGGSVFLKVLDQLGLEETNDTYCITALVRSQKKIDMLTQLKLRGVTFLQGSTDDHENLANLAANADIVFAIVLCSSSWRSG